MKISIIIVFAVSIAFPAERPKWIDATPKGYKNNYFVDSAASAKSESDAREKALGNAIAAVVHNANTTAQVNQTLQRQQSENFFLTTQA